MATVFDRWEKDSFFYAAEEVQESAERLESVHRRWKHEKKHVSKLACGGDGGSSPGAEFRRELHTALGTTKWQLEELEKAVRSNDEALSLGEDVVSRHSDFVAAISNKISIVEKDLKETNAGKNGCNALAWVNLDEGERDELALFLSCSLPEVKTVSQLPSGGYRESGSMMKGEASRNHCLPKETNAASEMMEEKVKGHCRTASALADVGELKISVSTEGSPRKLSNDQPNLPPTILSLSELRAVELASKPKWYRYGFRKGKAPSYEDMDESIPLQNCHPSRGLDGCYEKSKSCLNNCTDETDNKHIYGWLGAFQRQIQRSQYHIQYGGPIQIIIWVFVSLLLIAFFYYL